MRYSERQLEDIEDRIWRISMSAKVIEDELRKKKFAADEDYSFVEDLDLIISEAIKLKMDLE